MIRFFSLSLSLSLSRIKMALAKRTRDELKYIDSSLFNGQLWKYFEI